MWEDSLVLKQKPYAHAHTAVSGANIDLMRKASHAFWIWMKAFRCEAEVILIVYNNDAGLIIRIRTYWGHRPVSLCLTASWVGVFPCIHIVYVCMCMHVLEHEHAGRSICCCGCLANELPNSGPTMLMKEFASLWGEYDTSHTPNSLGMVRCVCVCVSSMFSPKALLKCVITTVLISYL